MNVADAASILRQLESRVDPASRKRAAAYFRQGRVSKVQTDSTSITSKVRGSYGYVYDVAIYFTSGDHKILNTECSCPISFDCKHVYATALTLLTLRDALAAPTSSSRIVAFAPPPPDPLIDTVRAELESRHGSPLPRQLGNVPQDVVRLWQNYKGRRSLYAHDIPKGLKERNARSYSSYNTIQNLEDMFEGRAESPLELFDAIVLCHELGRISLDPAVAKLGNIARPHAILSARLHTREIETWKKAFADFSRAAPLRQASVLGPYELELVVTASDNKLFLVDREGKREPVNKRRLEELKLDTLENGFAALTPGAAQFYLPIHQTLRAHGRQIPSRIDWDLDVTLNRLLRQPCSQGRVVNRAGAPIVLADEPLRFRVNPEPDDPERYARIELVLPNGEPLPPTARYLASSFAVESNTPEAYIVDDKLYDAPPSPSIGSSSHLIKVPWEAVKTPDGLAFLAQGNAIVPKQLDITVKRIVLRPQLQLAISADRDHATTFSASLLALDDEGKPFACFREPAWEPVKRPKSDQETIVAPDYSKADPCIDQLRRWPERLPPTRKDDNWLLIVGHTRFDEFSDWLRAFPDNLDIVLPAELKALLDPPAKARFDLSLENDPSQIDWFDVSVQLRADDTTLTDEEIALLLKAKGRFVHLKGKGWKRLTLDRDDLVDSAIERLGLEPTAKRPQRFHALQLAELRETDDDPGENAPEWQSALARIAKPEPIALPPPPPNLSAALRPYQTDGFHFLTHLTERQFGGILADDMGLGKTLQTLAWLSWLKSRKQPADGFKALVVCPKSVVDNWLSEPGKFNTGLVSRRLDNSLEQKDFAKTDLLVANYAQLRIKRDFLVAQKWDVVILDEGQNIKNPASQTAKAAYDLAAQHRLVLSGTPVENRLLDLWSLMRFAMPGLLGSQASFKRVYDGKNASPVSTAALPRRIKPFLLRRSKAQVATDLPPRTEEEIHCELEGDQRKLYQAELKKAQQALLRVKSDRQFDKERFNILQSLLRLRQICCDPRLVGFTSKGSVPSAKIDALLELIEPIVAEGNKVLVFSQFVSMLELLQTALAAKGIGYLTLTGATENRADLVTQFQQPDTEPVFLLSLKAAGSGLNLTAASYVVLFDPWWNPAVEAQAIDRTHRIGQTSQVIAYRLVAKDTIEQKIRALQTEKAKLANSVIQEESLASVLDLETLRSLLA